MKRSLFNKLVNRLLDYVDKKFGSTRAELEQKLMQECAQIVARDVAQLPIVLRQDLETALKPFSEEELVRRMMPLLPDPLKLKGLDGKTPTPEELTELIVPLIPAPVKGDAGSTPTNEELLKLITPLIPIPVKGEDGKTPSEDDLVELITPLIPAPVKGDDGKTPTEEELKALIVPLIPAPMTEEEITKLIVPLIPTVEQFKTELIAPLIPAPVRGEDGNTPTEEELKALIVPLIPAPVKGEDGKDGVAPTAEEVALKLREHTRSFVTEPEFMRSLVEAIPPPRDGVDGKSVTIADVKEFLTLQFAQWALEFERRGHDAIQRAIDAMPLPKDGLAIEDFEFDGDRRLKCMRGGTLVKEIVLPTIIDRGVWKEGQYERGDAVSFGGNFWIAQCDTTSKPGPAGGEEGSKHWRLAVRKGRDAKDR